MEARAEDLLPVEYFHVVFTLPAVPLIVCKQTTAAQWIAQIAYWNKRAVYGLLFKASAETVMTIAADPKRLGAKMGLTSVLHTWGSAMTHHRHIHMIVPGGGLSPDGNRWVACKPGFFLHVRVLSRLFRRIFLDGLMALHQAGDLAFFGDLERLAQAEAFAEWLAPFRKSEWVVYAKPPFGGPDAVLAYLSRYTHPLPGRRLRSNLPRGGQDVDQEAASARQDLPKSIRCSVCSPRNRRLRGPRSQRSPHSPCVSHAPVAAGPCASSRSSAVGKNRCRARHHGSRPHDISPVKDH
jgi:hypothetical protein